MKQVVIRNYLDGSLRAFSKFEGKVHSGYYTPPMPRVTYEDLEGRPSAVDYSVRRAQEAQIAQMFDVSPYMVWGSARQNGNRTYVADAMRQMMETGNVYFASPTGATLEEFLAKHPPPQSSEPKVNRRKKHRRKK